MVESLKDLNDAEIKEIKDYCDGKLDKDIDKYKEAPILVLKSLKDKSKSSVSFATQFLAAFFVFAIAFLLDSLLNFLKEVQSDLFWWIITVIITVFAVIAVFIGIIVFLNQIIEVLKADDDSYQLYSFMITLKENKDEAKELLRFLEKTNQNKKK